MNIKIEFKSIKNKNIPCVCAMKMHIFIACHCAK